MRGTAKRDDRSGTEKHSKNTNQKKKPKTKKLALRRAPRAGAQPEALPDRRRLLRHRPRRPDHQSARRRAAEHRHRPAASLVAGRGRQRGHRRVPQLVRAHARRTQSTANEETGAGIALQPTKSPAATTTWARDSTSPPTQLNFPAVFCMPGIDLEPEFNAVSPVEINETVGFDAGESIITLERRRALQSRQTRTHLREDEVELRRRHRHRRLRARALRNAKRRG